MEPDRHRRDVCGPSGQGWKLSGFWSRLEVQDKEIAERIANEVYKLILNMRHLVRLSMSF